MIADPPVAVLLRPRVEAAAAVGTVLTPRTAPPPAAAPLPPPPPVVDDVRPAPVDARPIAAAAASVSIAPFEPPIAPAPPPQPISVGAFDRAPTRSATTADPRRIVVGAALQAARPTPAAAAAAGEIAPAGFDKARPRRPVAAAQTSVDPIDVPVEILFKPPPEYTDEAKALGVQGDVVLEVEFGASGDVRVLGVVRGLGHGLDDSAMRAARGIRFSPARTAGRPVDVRTTVHIVFRLS
jgi:TonB family protein